MTDEELIARLRKARKKHDEFEAVMLSDTAADRIEALVKEKGYSLGRVMELDDRAERLEARCKALIAAYDKANWMRTADYHGDECDCLRCHFDHLRTALKGADHE